MQEQGKSRAYEAPAVEDFGSLWDNTFLNPGGHIKFNGNNFDAHLELAGNEGS